ncbi:hypothetical protein M9Y10_012516 [Tritrichomonas musculus]|uniref:Uncharacterized protein n=1 Tax=Tritrichomonas musculus TaxID=1915356 RepID=A0ABR2IDU6_9EUKA
MTTLNLCAYAMECGAVLTNSLIMNMDTFTAIALYMYISITMRFLRTISLYIASMFLLARIKNHFFRSLKKMTLHLIVRVTSYFGRWRLQFD